jgi:DNA-binding NtrC family response regulator
MPPSRSAPSALIVEDEPRYRAFLAEVLRDMECIPVTASTAGEAARLVRQSPPDMLLLDLNLPLVDGISFLEQFRCSCPDAPVVIITGFGDLDSARRAIHLGVTDFLTKPCDLGQIEAAIDRARRRLAGAGAPAQDRPAPEPPRATEDVRPLAIVERETILDAIRSSRGNRSAAARRLGISRRALYNKITEYRRQGHETP